MYRTHAYAPKNTKDFLAVGDPYLKKKEINPRFRGTQFKTNPAKLGQNAGTFTKFPEHKSEVYVDSFKAPAKSFKNIGFGSNDPDRRGTMVVDVICKQWKEKLEAERKPFAGTEELLGDDEELDQEAAEASFRQTFPNPKWFQTQVPFHSYDIGRDGENGTTPICNKCSRETFYCRHRIKAKAPKDLRELRRGGSNGIMSPTSYNNYGSWTGESGGGFPSYVPLKTKAGRVSTTKQFFDNSHLSPGWA